MGRPAIEGIRAEREALRPIRRMADLIVDTSQFTVHQLRDYVRERYDVREEGRRLVVSVVSFGFKFGVPAEADLVFDVRFLPNPNFVPRLKRQTGGDAAVVRFLRAQPETEAFLRRALSLVHFVLPRHEREGRSVPHDRGRVHGGAASLGDGGQPDRRRRPEEGLPGGGVSPGPQAGVRR